MINNKYDAVSAIDPMHYKPIGKKYVLDISAPRACFTDPVSPMEKTSYPFPTPSALAAAIGSVYVHPPIKWDITKIEIMNPVQYESHTVKYQGYATHTAFDQACVVFRMYSKDDDKKNQLVRVTGLKDVRYRVTAQMLYWNGAYESLGIPVTEPDSSKKHVEIFERRMERKQRYADPYLGIREDACRVELASKDFLNLTPADVSDSYFSVHHILRDDRAKLRKTYYYQCKCEHGLILVPSLLDTKNVILGGI